MANLLNLASSPLLSLLVLTLLYHAFNSHNQTILTLYFHDSLTGPDATAVTVAGTDGPTSNALRFGTLMAFVDPVTAGPDPTSREIGRAQGMYINSQRQGKAMHIVFSIIFNDGEYKGSTLEIQGADLYIHQREFSVVSGTGYFRFVKGYVVVTNHLLDLPNLRAILKFDIVVNHY